MPLSTKIYWLINHEINIWNAGYLKNYISGMATSVDRKLLRISQSSICIIIER